MASIFTDGELAEFKALSAAGSLEARRILDLEAARIRDEAITRTVARERLRIAGDAARRAPGGTLVQTVLQDQSRNPDLLAVA